MPGAAGRRPREQALEQHDQAEVPLGAQLAAEHGRHRIDGPRRHAVERAPVQVQDGIGRGVTVGDVDLAVAHRDVAVVLVIQVVDEVEAQRAVGALQQRFPPTPRERGEELVLQISDNTDIEAVLRDASETYVALSDRYQGDLFDLYDPEQAYCHWFEVLLPFSFHDSLLEPDVLESAIVTWRAALSSGPRARQATADLHELLMRRLDAHLQGSPAGSPARRRLSWLYGYKRLFQSVSHELVEPILDLEDEYLERSKGGSLGRDATDEMVELTRTSEDYQYAKHLTIEGERQERLLRDLLEQLRV